MATAEPLVYATFVAAAIGAAAVYAAMPRRGRVARRGLLILVAALAVGGVFVVLGGMLKGASSPVPFGVLTILALVGALRVVTHPRPGYAAVYFILVILSTAVLAILCGAEFLGFALIAVYAGAILVTYLFVILLAQPSPHGPAGELSEMTDYNRNAREPGLAVVAGFVLVAVVAWAILDRKGAEAMTTASGEEIGNTLSLARVLMTEHAISLELAGVLLLVALVGAVALARRRLPQSGEGVEGLPPGEIGKRVSPY